MRSNLSTQTEMGNTPLHIAAREELTKVASLILHRIEHSFAPDDMIVYLTQSNTQK